MIDHIDHIVLCTAQEKICIFFYTEVLGMALKTFGENRKAFHFGNQKINLIVKDSESMRSKSYDRAAPRLELCLISKKPIVDVIERLAKFHIPILEGPVIRSGATGKVISVYIYDPDLNLLQISELVED